MTSRRNSRSGRHPWEGTAPFQQCVGQGVGGAAQSSLLRDTLGRQTGPSGPGGSPLCCPACSSVWSATQPFIWSHLPGVDPQPLLLSLTRRRLGPHPISLLVVPASPAQPGLWARPGEDVGSPPNRTAITGCLGPWEEAGAGWRTHARRDREGSSQP